MIEFYGRFDTKSSKKMSDKKYKQIAFGTIGIFGVLMVVFLIMYFTKFITKPFLIGAGCFGVFCILISFIVPPIMSSLDAKAIKTQRPISKITIASGLITQIFISEKDKSDYMVTSRHFVNEAREVIDDGKNYHIVIYEVESDGFSYYDVITCKKSQIRAGTIEDFEKLFEGKIKIDKDYKREYDN